MNEENQMIGEGVEDAESEGGSEQDGREMPQDSDDDPHIQETWIEWMRRRTRLTENILESLRLDDWVQTQTQEMGFRWPQPTSRGRSLVIQLVGFGAKQWS